MRPTFRNSAICTKCMKQKLLKDFDGKRAWCRKCCTAYAAPPQKVAVKKVSKPRFDDYDSDAVYDAPAYISRRTEDAMEVLRELTE